MQLMYKTIIFYRVFTTICIIFSEKLLSNEIPVLPYLSDSPVHFSSSLQAVASLVTAPENPKTNLPPIPSTRASTVPSPPSARGFMTTSASKSTFLFLFL